MSVRIEEFPKGDQPWRIDGLGCLVYPGGQSEPLVAVHLSELKTEYRDPLSNSSLTGKGAVIYVKVGQIALLKHGSVWLNQVRLPKAPLATGQLTLTNTQLKLCSFDAHIDLNGISTPLLPRRRFEVSTRSWKGLAGSWYAVATSPHPDVEFIVIPSAVIFQKCLATSPRAARRLAFGNLNALIGSPHWVPGEPKTYYVEVAKDIKTSEAPALANLRADKVARDEYIRFRHSLVVNSVNDDRTRAPLPPATHIKLNLPFSNTVHLEVEGKNLPLDVTRDGKKLWGFLVTEIVALSTELVFDRLVTHRDNDGRQGENADDPMLKTAWVVPPQHAGDVDSVNDVPLHSNDDPLATLEALSLEESGGFEAKGLDLVQDPKITQRYRHLMTGGADSRHDGSTTTGDPLHSKHGAAELAIETEETPSVPVTLEQFFEALDLLRREGLAFQTIVAAPTHRYNGHGDVVNYLPRTIGRVRSWHLIETAGKVVPKGYVVATVRHGGIWHYFIELERKGSEALALCYVRDASGVAIDPRRIHLFMIDNARKNGWNPSSQPHWIFKSIKHSPSRGVARFSRSIADAIGLTPHLNIPGQAPSFYNSLQIRNSLRPG